MLKALLAASVFAVLTGSAMAQSVAPRGTAQNTAAKSVPPSDARLEQDIRARLARSKINSDHFTVSVRNGIATLEGTTDVAQHKGVATRLARLAGAAAVRNNIRVSEAGKAKARKSLDKNKLQPEKRGRVTPGF